MLDKVKRKNILKEIFEKIHNKRKLKIIKYSIGIWNKLDIIREDFEIYLTLKEFNNKYNNIEDIDINELNISERYIGNEGLIDLVKFKFKFKKF